MENFHNGKIHRNFWLEDWEKEKISEYYRVHATEGYRAVAYRMMDEDVVLYGVSGAKVARILHSME